MMLIEATENTLTVTGFTLTKANVTKLHAMLTLLLDEQPHDDSARLDCQLPNSFKR